MNVVISSTRFRGYVRELKALNADVLRSGGMPLTAIDLAHAHLDGRASRELRAAVDITALREIGAFFTGEALADAVVQRAMTSCNDARFLDPSCGCGDLLLAAARRMEVERGLDDTLTAWGARLSGTDLVPEFVETTRERLLLLALLRGAKPGKSRPDLNRLLPDISIGDGRGVLPAPSGVVLLNPPYGQVPAPAGTAWASGLVTEAALWIADLADAMTAGMRIVAVLPDVLRSGARYARWRMAVGEQLTVGAVETVGQFDALTDVDVFVLEGQKGVTGGEWCTAAAHCGQVLDDVARVSVGPVVDRRDGQVGDLVPYVTTRDLPQAGGFAPTDLRRFGKRLFQPPFVVLRRTSRPTVGEPRLRPVIIRGRDPVAVENHLIVVEPAGGASWAACERLVEVLAAESTTEWLNARIRLRHLTVTAVREIPTGADAASDAP